MNPEDIIEIIKQLAELANPAVSHIYGVYVRQAVIDGVLLMVLPALLLGCLAGLALWVSKICDEDHKAGKCGCCSPDGCNGLILFLRCVVPVGCLVIYLMFLGKGLGMLLNPEYQALQSLIGSIR